jgi:ABC-2 type transport system ATP-binding protein
MVTSQSMEAIAFKRVTKVFQDRLVALTDISFAVPVGSTVGLLGANGAGKSTALRIALGLIKQSAGDVRVFGSPMNPGAKSLRQRVGFLSDEPVFPKDLTALGYLRFVGKCFGLPRREHNARMGMLLNAVGLTNDAGRAIRSYSTGMKTRLAIAASLMNDPELLIWDEPTAGLDPISRRQTLDLLEQYRGKKTVILSSHILGDIDRVCDRLLVLNQGQLLFDGSRADLESLLPESVLEVRLSRPTESLRTAIKARLGREDQGPDPGVLRIELRADERVGDIVALVLELAKQAEVDVVGINSTGRRLEDAYMKLVSDDEFSGLLRAAQG